jgi:hypothetical protein
LNRSVASCSYFVKGCLIPLVNITCDVIIYIIKISLQPEDVLKKP